MLYPVLKHAHSVIRWLLITGLLASVTVALYSMYKKKSLVYPGGLFSRLTVYTAHVQLLIGILLYLISPKVIFSPKSMSSPILRFYLIEHVFIMILVIVLITVGYVRMKKTGPGNQSARQLFWYYMISLILILALIPWPFMSYGGQWY
jgi:hypothetical protein